MRSCLPAHVRIYLLTYLCTHGHVGFPIICPSDVSVEPDCKRIADVAAANMDGIDVLVLNAGLSLFCLFETPSSSVHTKSPSNNLLHFLFPSPSLLSVVYFNMTFNLLASTFAMLIYSRNRHARSGKRC